MWFVVKKPHHQIGKRIYKRGIKIEGWNATELFDSRLQREVPVRDVDLLQSFNVIGDKTDRNGHDRSRSVPSQFL